MALTPLSADAAILEYSYTVGTGTYTLAGALSGCLPFSDAPEFAGAATGTYQVTNGTPGVASNMEIATGIYNPGAKTLTRATIVASTNGGAAVNWPANAQGNARTRLLVRALVPAAAAGNSFGVGAVGLDRGMASVLTGLPTMTDASTGTLSCWLYTTQAQVPQFRCDGDMAFNSSAFLLTDPSDFLCALAPVGVPSVSGGGPPSYKVTSISNEPQALVTLSGLFGTEIQAGSFVRILGFSQASWFVSGNPNMDAVRVMAVNDLHFVPPAMTSPATPNIRLDWDTTGYPAYDPAMNPGATVGAVLNAFDFNSSDNIKNYYWNTVLPMPHDQWVNVLVSWNMGQSAGNKLFNLFYTDQQAPPSTGGVIDTDSSFVIPYSTAGSWGILGDPAAGPTTSPAYAAEFWFAPGVYIDFTVAANRHKFHDVTGRPISLGTQGELPTGSPPTVYLTMPRSPVSPSAWANNASGAGALTILGQLFLAPTSPTDP